jgi:hypothetical protein
VPENGAWGVVQPPGPWSAGETITLDASALCEDGAAATASAAFRILANGDPAWGRSIEEPAPQPNPNGEAGAQVFRILQADRVPTLIEGRGAAYRITPEAPFDTPRRVWLPVPEAQGAAPLGAAFLNPRAPASWHWAENAEGFIVPGSFAAATVDGVEYFGFLVNHGGVVQLARAESAGRRASGAGVPWALAAALGLAAAGFAIRKRRARSIN